MTENTEAGVVSNSTNIPSWVTQDYFENIVRSEFENFSKITKFAVESGAPPGENYASIMLRILIEVELQDGTNTDFSLMMKTTHSLDTEAGKLVADMGVFTKEVEIYEKILPEFEKMYLERGKKIQFGPRSFRLAKDPGVDTVVLEDLRIKKFKNANRLEGLNLEHTESVLKKLAEYHAASAVYYETKKPFAKVFDVGMLDPAKKEFYIPIYGPMFSMIKTSIEKNTNNGKYYADKIFIDVSEMLDKIFEASRIKDEEFNVLNHGDCWSNNFMFKYNEKGEREETALIDFQMCKYGSPAQDLLYFIFTSPKQEIRLEKFDYLIKYYHDNLIENLVLLEYPKDLPTLASLHIAVLRNHQWAPTTATSTLAIVLLDPMDNANIDNFIKTDEEGADFKSLVYSNPRYIRCLNDILPWLDNRGMLE